MRQKIPRGPIPPQIKVSDKQDEILQQIIRRHSSAQSLVRRAQIVRAGTEYGRRDTQIGRDLNCSAQMVRTWRHRWIEGWEQLGAIEANGDDQELEVAIIAALADQPRPGTPATFTAEDICQIIKVACENPSLSGRPITEWTPRELADEVVKREIVASISATQVGRFLKRGGVATASEPVLAQQQAARKPGAV
jgi:putative transposase